jgi:hypothetical protein
VTFKTFLYRALSVSNDVKAVSKGPAAIGRRLVRKSAYKGTTRILREQD